MTQPNAERMTAHRLEAIRIAANDEMVWGSTARELLRELDATRRERDEEHAQRLEDLDDLARMTDERDEARGMLDSVFETGERMRITDEMVERAADEVWRDCDCCTVAGSKITARRALTAAMAKAGGA